MKKLRSRKGFTLVELVVTVAILSIVLGLGTGAFIMVMQNYGTASSTEQEQEKATQIEDNILQAARVATDIKFLDSGTDAIPSDEGTYIFCKDGSDIVQMYDYETFTGETSVTQTPSIDVGGVKKLIFSLKLQKNQKTTAPENKFLYLNYKIEMQNGYTLSGSVEMNNMKSEGKTVVASSSSVDNVKINDKVNLVVCDSETSIPSSNKAIVFIK